MRVEQHLPGDDQTSLQRFAHPEFLLADAPDQ